MLSACPDWKEITNIYHVGHITALQGHFYGPGADKPYPHPKMAFILDE